MGYGVKWVEENLGISRKVLRLYEENSLMPPNTNKKARDYSDEDIDRIWLLRVFQGMGYTLTELKSMAEGEPFDFDEGIKKKIGELEKKKAEIERHIGYAKSIKLTGRLPTRPKEGVAVPFEEFHEESLDRWNVNSDPGLKRCAELADLILDTPEDRMEDADIERLSSFMLEVQERISNIDALFAEKVLPQEILKRKDRGPADAEVQLLVKLLYENRVQSLHEVQELTQKQFARLEASGYMNGDVARLHEQDHGKEGCRFIADAIAVFGGYESYDGIGD